MSSASANDEVASDLTGRQLGDYLLLRLLGRGGMASVYLAQQQSLRRTVAFKVLKPALAVDASYVRRFHREAQAAASLIHPNIVQIFEVGCLEGLHFIAQEYVAGKNVKQVLARQPALPVAEAISLLRQVASALYKAEQAGVVHRDIKPENILVGADGAVKVADFGLARLATDREQLELTQVGMTLGTPLYMSPEQIEGRDLDSRSDIYSLGVTAYQILAGRPPFDGENAIRLAMQQLQAEPQPIEQLRGDIPLSLAEMIHRMLRKDRCQRPSSREILDQLSALGEIATAAEGRPIGTLTPPRTGVEGSREATGQLARALRQSDRMRSIPWLPGGRWWLALPSGLVGAWLAWRMVSVDPLALLAASADSHVRRMDTMEAQYFYAHSVDTEAAWKSVVNYHEANPGAMGARDRFFQRSAEQQLGRWYLEHEQPRNAISVYESLTRLEAPERYLRAVGYAGLTVAHAQLRDWDAALAAYSRFLPFRQEFERENQDAYLGDELDWVVRQLAPLQRGRSRPN